MEKVQELYKISEVWDAKNKGRTQSSWILIGTFQSTNFPFWRGLKVAIAENSGNWKSDFIYWGKQEWVGY